MPSITKPQQRLMGQALAVRKFKDSKGKEGKNPKEIKSPWREEIVRLSKSMTKKSLEDFASTPHKDLKEDLTETEINTVPTIYPYLNPDSKKSSKKSESSKLMNLCDYREYINRIKK
jgi:hypothetical protein